MQNAITSAAKPEPGPDRRRHGLPNTYPFTEPGFNESQAASARWVIYRGIANGSEWTLCDGTLLEIWPGGYIFNEWGTVCGYLDPALAPPVPNVATGNG